MMFELEVEWRDGQFLVMQRNPHARGAEAGYRSGTPHPEDRASTERRALEWIESQPVPVVVASLAPPSSAVYVPIEGAYLPVNGLDTERPQRPTGLGRLETRLSTALVRALTDAQRRLLELRTRAASPARTGGPPRLRLVWSVEPPAELRPALRTLCRRALSSDPSPPPSPPSHRAALDTAPRVGSRFGRDWVVFAGVGGAPPSVVRCEEVTERFRTALVDRADAPLPLESRDRRASAAAVVPLPLVVHPRASVPLVGIAVVWPRGLHHEARRAVLRSIARWETGARDRGLELRFESGAAWTLRRIREEASTPTLRPGTWCAPSAVWATATPIALVPDQRWGRRPTDPARRRLVAQEAAQSMVAASCADLGLPKPSSVELQLASALPGGLDARAFRPFSRHAGAALVHARVRFPHPVQGPVLLGSGCDRGLGLCQPVAEDTRVQSGPNQDVPMFDPWPF